MKTKLKITIILGILLIASVGISFISSLEQRRDDPFFTYHTDITDSFYVQVVSGIAKEVPFAFQVEENLDEVILELTDAALNESGITLLDRNVRVDNGLAAASVLFAANPKNTLKPGTYSLTIALKDKANKQTIRQGEIPFIVDMHKTIAKCSC